MNLHNQKIIKYEGATCYNTAQALIAADKALPAMEESAFTYKERFEKSGSSVWK
jgi:hypothetical protein